MEYYLKFKTVIFTAGSAAFAFFAKVDNIVLYLMALMCIDWMIGGIIVPILFKKSPKTESGGASSKIGFIGLCKKICMMLGVVAGYFIDKMTGLNMVYTAVIFGFGCNEILSIIENLGVIGVPMPEAVKNAVDILTDKSKDGLKYE